MPFRIVGSVQSISGLTIEASDLPLPLGSLVPDQQLWRANLHRGGDWISERSHAADAAVDHRGAARGDRIENHFGAADRLFGSIAWAGAERIRQTNRWQGPVECQRDPADRFVRQFYRWIGPTSASRSAPASGRSMGCTPAGWGSGWGFFRAPVWARARCFPALRRTPARIFR